MKYQASEVTFTWKGTSYQLFGYSSFEISDSRTLTQRFSKHPAQRGRGVPQAEGFDTGEEITIVSTYLDESTDEIIKTAFNEVAGGGDDRGTLLLSDTSTGQVVELSRCIPKMETTRTTVSSEVNDVYSIVFSGQITKNTMRDNSV